MEAAVKAFFSSSRFAVAGASSDPAKFGYKVFVWYLQHKLPVTPVTPTAKTVQIGRQQSSENTYETVSAPSALSNPSQTSLSIITPPKITRKLLEDAKEVGVPAIWLQPGSFDEEVLKYARKQWPDAAVAGKDVPGSRGGDGWCVLVDGDWGLSVAGRSGGKPERSNL